jgi:hypothetical protein
MSEERTTKAIFFGAFCMCRIALFLAVCAIGISRPVIATKVESWSGLELHPELRSEMPSQRHLGSALGPLAS